MLPYFLTFYRATLFILFCLIANVSLYAQTLDQRNITNDLDHAQRAIPVDFDGDGDVDIVGSYSLADAVYLLLNNGDGSSWQRVLVAGDFVAMYALPVDIDSDGDLDIAAVELFDRDLGFESNGRLSWFENPGDVTTPNWQEHTIESSLVHLIYLDTGDIDQDGDQDLAAVTSSATADNVVVWYENRLNENADWQRYDVASGDDFGSAGSVRVADVDAHGNPEILVADETGNRIVWFNSQGNAKRDDWPTITVVEGEAGPSSARPYDVDGDGDLDVVAAFLGSQQVVWYENGENWNAHLISDMARSKDLVMVDLNNDGLLDISFGSPEPIDWVYVYLNNGDGDWSVVNGYSYYSFTAVEAADIDQDGYQDLITSSYNGNRIDWWQNSGGMISNTPTPMPPTATPTPNGNDIPTPTPTATRPFPTDTPTSAPEPDRMFYTDFESLDSISSPQIGVGGSTTLLPGDFVDSQFGNGANFNRPGNNCETENYQTVLFPLVQDGNQYINLDKGEIAIWYIPHYDAGANDDTAHTLVSISSDPNGYNPPTFSIVESDQLWFTITQADYSSVAVGGGYHAPLWNAGDLVFIRAAWDNSNPTDSMHLYVNNIRVHDTPISGGWDLGDVSEMSGLRIGSQTECGDFIADGVIDELTIYNQPRVIPTPTPSSRPIPTNTPTFFETSPTPETTPTVVDMTPTPTMEVSPTATVPAMNVGVTDPEAVITPAPIALQPVGVPFVDPAFGTTMIRLTDASERGEYAAHVYSQLQAFSYDNEYVLITGSEGYRVMRMEDFTWVEDLVTWTWNNPRWHPTLPHTIVHYDSNEDTTLRVQYTNVDTLETTTVFTFPEPYERIRVNQSFDELSKDGRWMAGMASQSGGSQVIFSLDLETMALGAELPLDELYGQNGLCLPDPQWGVLEPDWIGVSPLGNYLVIQWQRDWGEGAQGVCHALESYNIETGDFIGRIYDGHQHGDLGVLPDGETEIFYTSTFENPEDNNLPALVYHELPGTPNGFSELHHLRTVNWGVGEHISAQGPHGVALIGSGMLGGEDEEWFPFRQELFLLYADGSVLRLGHTRSSSCGYWVQPRASISNDGRYVIFDSDWAWNIDTNSCIGEFAELGQGDVYVIDLIPNQSAIKDWSIQ